MKTFKPIKQLRASHEVLGQLKEAILRGQIKLGDKLPSERELCSQFQVSRGVVREAIRVLEMTGFVVVRQGPNGGAYINELTPDRLSSGFLDFYLAGKLSIPELNQVRQHLEPEVASLAAERINDEYAERLLAALEVERQPFQEIREHMWRLTNVHFILAEMCGNYLYEAIINSMIKLTHEIIAAIDPQDLIEIHPVGEHDPVVKAVLAADPSAAAEAMRNHLAIFCQALLRMDQEYKGQGLRTKNLSGS